MAFKADLTGLGEVGDEVKQLLELSAVFRADQERIAQSCTMDLAEQFWRRIWILIASTHIDSQINCMKRIALAASKFSGVTFSDEETQFLTKPGFVPALKNIKLCWQVFRRALEEPDLQPNETGQWDAFACAINVSNRLVHPKRASDLKVSDEEFDAFTKGALWFTESQAVLAENATKGLTQLTRQKKIYLRSGAKIGRNEICPKCNSGKKYKDCCGSTLKTW